MTNSQKLRMVDTLKEEGLFFAAGALLAQIGYPRAYGPHFGMRSTLETDRAEFYRGYDAAETGARR